MKRGMLCLCLCLMLLVGQVLPTSAAVVRREGTCGDDITWQQYRDGTLFISGTGKMDDFGLPPWYSYEPGDQITGIVISEGITYIGERAFMDCDDVTEIILPSTLKELGKEAFFGCSGLKELILPPSVKRIGDYAFRGCTGLKQMVIPEKVKEMGGAVFSGCTNMKKVIFLGDAPAFSEYSRWDHTMGTFQDLKANVYYPEDNDTWTKKILKKDYEGDIDWKPLDDEELEKYASAMVVPSGTIPPDWETMAPSDVQPTVPPVTEPPQAAMTDEEILRALNGVLVGMRSGYAQLPANTDQWSDEDVARYIYCKLIWDNFTYSPDSYLSKAGLTIGSGDDYMWHFDLNLIRQITVDSLGREYPENVVYNELYVSGEELLVSPAAGESSWFIVHDFVPHGDQIIAVGSAIYISGLGQEFNGYFRAVFDRNPGSIYGFTLVSLENIGDGKVYGNLTASASSTLKEPSITHWPERVLDGDLGTAWVEAAPGVGVGEWIRLETADGSMMDVTALEFALGYQKNDDILQKNGWPCTVRVTCGDGYQETFEFYTLSDMAVLDRTVRTSWIEITILDAVPGYKYEDICISEISVLGMNTQTHLQDYVLNNPPVYAPTEPPAEPDTQPPETTPETLPENQKDTSKDEGKAEAETGAMTLWLVGGAVALVTVAVIVIVLVTSARRNKKRRRNNNQDW